MAGISLKLRFHALHEPLVANGETFGPAAFPLSPLCAQGMALSLGRGFHP